MRRTVASLTPISAAIVRVLQWVALAGLDCVVLRINSSLSLAEMAGFPPGRGGSFCRAARTDSRKPLPPHAGLLLLIFRFKPISQTVFPPAANNTILARSICRAGRERDLTHCCRVSRCDLSMVTGGATRIGRLLDCRDVR